MHCTVVIDTDRGIISYIISITSYIIHTYIISITFHSRIYFICRKINVCIFRIHTHTHFHTHIHTHIHTSIHTHFHTHTHTHTSIYTHTHFHASMKRMSLINISGACVCVCVHVLFSMSYDVLLY